MDIIGTKVLVAILFGVIRFAFGILPIQVCSWLTIESEDLGKRVITKSRRRILDYGIAKMQSFGGGVLFATCLLHMMPEVYYSVEELRRFGILRVDYPYSQLVVSLGFFLIYFLEEISHWIISRTPQEPCKRTERSNVPSSTVAIISNGVPQTEKNEKLKTDSRDNLSMEIVVDEEVQTENMRNLEKNEMDFDEELNTELEHIIEKQVKTKQQVIRCIFVVLALSFHAIFEGLAIGLQHSVSNIWYLFTAVSVHSATILFCIGLEIFLAGTRTRTIIFHMLFLAVVSPIGVILGLVVSLTADAHSSVKSFSVVFLEGISAGTILYITFFEVLIREKERRACRVKRAVYIAAGFALMAGLECLKFAE
ncbi:hypothetical protein ILUMI_25496 [Ignelater luminosus]|uniref:Uncharacterized protein n=1 Tax=Ignelater luminosus TaxID=2038154 RepID=A0A8K0FXV8_IGNLU|nr:hypothetical protein ILUMI_25496 [Ignelater luminosus]